MSVGRPRTIKPLEFYGLKALGYADAIPLSGDWLRDQLTIEGLCFRIKHDPAEGGLGAFEHFRNAVDLIYNDKSRKSPKRFIWHDWAEMAIREFSANLEVGLAGSASSGKTSPAALWAVVNYLLDPTHVKVLTFTTTIKEAKDRIWKEVIEFWEAVPNGPGKLLKSTNQIQGLNFSGDGFGTSSGLYLYAADKSNESSAYNSMIGTKVAKTGEPTDDPDVLLKRPEYRDLLHMGFDIDHVRDLVLRLQELALDRRGKLIVIIDEATGVSTKLLDAYFSNLKVGNSGRVQMIVIGNPSSHFDAHGIFCEPAAGWASINENMDKWNTVTGGVCIHFHGEKNPRIVNKDERLVWMPTERANKENEDKYGRNSYEYWRMVVGFWAPEGVANSIYCEADFTQNQALEGEDKVIWGLHSPIMLCGFDPAFTSEGDRAVARFGKLGFDHRGRQVLEVLDEATVNADITLKDVPVAEQLAIRWKLECQKRGVLPENACFDASGGGVSFAALVHRLWSPKARAVNSGGKASEKALPGEKTADGKPLRSCDKYANRATELWCAPLRFLRTGQLKNIPRELAKELCGRQKAKNKGSSNLDKIQIEKKSDYKGREKHSPDASDAFNLLVDEAVARHGFRPNDNALPGQPNSPKGPRAKTPWEEFKERARRTTRGKTLKKG